MKIGGKLSHEHMKNDYMNMWIDENISLHEIYNQMKIYNHIKLYNYMKIYNYENI